MAWTAERTRALREHMGLSQTEFADRLGFARYQTVSEIETGRRDVTATIGKLLDYIAREAGFEQPSAGGIEAVRSALNAARSSIDEAARSLGTVEPS